VGLLPKKQFTGGHVSGYSLFPLTTQMQSIALCEQQQLAHALISSGLKAGRRLDVEFT